MLSRWCLLLCVAGCGGEKITPVEQSPCAQALSSSGTRFTIQPGQMYVALGSRVQLSVVAPAACQPVVYSVDLKGSAVVSVTPSGLVGGIKFGEAYISAVASDAAIRDSLHVTVGSTPVVDRSSSEARLEDNLHR